VGSDYKGIQILVWFGVLVCPGGAVMSADGETDLVMKGVVHGAVDYLIKPVRIEELRNLWQHVVRREAPHQRQGGYPLL